MENSSLYIEILGTLFGVAYVILAAKKNIWCWIAGIISSVLMVYLFWIYSKLYAEAILYMYYVIAGIVGWVQWSNPKTDRPFIIKVDSVTHVFFVVIGVVLSFLLYFLISIVFSDAAKPLIDSFTTVFSFLATWITIRKWISSWVYWIVIDLISVGLYWSRDLNIYAFLMIVYTVLAVYGYYSWKKSEIKTVRFNKIFKGSESIA
tara:strand:+ start:188 stop:802 length:615 start_codon:yes stop_codon:yes gene_type:complete